MGLPGKPDSMDGTEFERYFLHGKIKEIADYCETDVVNTYRVCCDTSCFEENYPIRISSERSELERLRQGAEQHETAFGGVDLNSIPPRGYTEKGSHRRSIANPEIKRRKRTLLESMYSFLQGTAEQYMTHAVTTVTRRNNHA